MTIDPDNPHQMLFGFAKDYPAIFERKSMPKRSGWSEAWLLLKVSSVIIGAMTTIGLGTALAIQKHKKRDEERTRG